MIHYNDYDLYKYKDFTKIQKFLGGKEIENEQIWDIARESKEIPIFENILYYETLRDIQCRAKEEYNLDLEFYINSRDTHLYNVKNVEYQEILELEDLKEAITKSKKND
jgi:hypothetical protein